MAIPRKLTGNYVETLVDGEVLIVDLKGGELLSLEGTGRAIWDLIDGQRSHGAILDELSARYDAPGEQIERDLRDLLSELERAGLIALQ